MTDRYDEGLRVLAETPAPDQWDEIQERSAAAASTEAHVIYLDGKRRHQPRPLWTVWTAAAAVVVLAVMGAMALASRDTSNVTDTGPAGTPRRADTTTTEPSDTTTEPDSSTTTDPEPEPDGQPAEAPAVPPPSPEEGTSAPDTSTTTGAEMTNCLNVEFRSSNTHADLDQVQHPRRPDSPEVPIEDLRSRVLGIFESSESEDRAVFVIDGGGLLEEGVTWVPVPELGVDAETLYGGTTGNGTPTGVAQITVGFDPAPTCTFGFFATGLSEDEFISFVSGLAYAH